MASKTNPVPSGRQAHPPPPPLSSTFTAIEAKYREIWLKCPYTSMLMFYYLVTGVPNPVGFKTWEGFLQTGATNLKATGLDADHIPTETPDALYKKDSGLCTSFTLRVLSETGQRESFSIGNVVIPPNPGGHRAGWKRVGKEAIIVDSSARQAVFSSDALVECSVTYGAERKTVKWKFQENTLLMKSYKGNGPGGDFNPFNPMNTNPMHVCLSDLLPQNEIVLLFRNVHPQTNRMDFFGMMKWNFATKTCMISGNDYNFTFKFRTNNPPDTDNKAWSAFLGWVGEKMPSGITRKAQMDQVGPVQKLLWAAAVAVWGPPTIPVEFVRAPPSESTAVQQTNQTPGNPPAVRQTTTTGGGNLPGPSQQASSGTRTNTAQQGSSGSRTGTAQQSSSVTRTGTPQQASSGARTGTSQQTNTGARTNTVRQNTSGAGDTKGSVRR